MGITIKEVKHFATDSGAVPSNDHIDLAPKCVVLDAGASVAVANSNVKDKDQPQGVSAQMGQAIDEGPTIVVGTDTVIKTEHASSEAPQSDEFASAPAIDLPGIVDEEPVDPDHEDQGHEVELTEDFLADAFVECFGGNIRFDHDAGRWYSWNGAYWEKDEKCRVFQMARLHCRDLRGGDKRMASKKSIAGVESMARCDRRVALKSDAWDNDPWLLGTPKGYVNLKTGELMPPDPGLMISKVTSVVPAAKGTPFPHYNTFLDQVTAGDTALKRFLQQHAGYSLTGVTSEQVLLFIYGPGGNGKSQFQNVLAEILGDYAKTAAMETLTASKHQRHLTEIAMLDGARFVGMSETEKGQKWSQARINQLTGGDRVTANYMRQDMFTFVPKFKLMIVGNHKPQLGTVNEAARRRVLMVPFMFKPEKPDKTLAAKLRAEYPAILRWMIDGCLDWRENDLVLPQVVKQATYDYFEDEDVFGRWISERCECAPGLKSKAMCLYESWKDYASASGEEPGTSIAFAEMLAQRGFKKIKSDGVKYVGIALRPISKLNFGGDL